MNRTTWKRTQHEQAKKDKQIAEIVEMAEGIAEIIADGIPGCTRYMQYTAARFPPFKDDPDDVKRTHYIDMLAMAIYSALTYNYENGHGEEVDIDHLIETNDEGELELIFYVRRGQSMEEKEEEED
jgi:hypothetical protein